MLLGGSTARSQVARQAVAEYSALVGDEVKFREALTQYQEPLDFNTLLAKVVLCESENPSHLANPILDFFLSFLKQHYQGDFSVNISLIDEALVTTVRILITLINE